MKDRIKKSLLFLSLVFTVIFTSCRSEDDLSIDPPIDANIEANSTIARLIGKVALNDGSKDNIIDRASNLSVQLPVTVTVNGTIIDVTSSDDFEQILDSFDLSDTDDDVVNISYPITVVLPNYSTVVVNSDTELNDLTVNSDTDDDIECIDFEYPITASVFNENSDTVTTITINNDNQMYNFIEDLDEFAAVTINFPITVVLVDGSSQVINNIQELEDAIEAAEGTCDEDDDNDFDDCSTNTYTPTNFDDSILGCTTWTIDKLRRNNNNLVDLYVDYTFAFNSDGTLLVTENANEFNGTWDATGTAGDVDVTINVVGLPDFNDTWNLCQINLQSIEKKVELKIGTDRLRFGSTCENDPVIDDSALVSVLTTGDWYVNYLFETTDDTADYIDYVFNFGTDNMATATDMSGPVNGTWSTASGDQTALALNLDFGTGAPLDRLAEGWDVLESTTDIIRLQYSGGAGQDVFLNFGRTPFDPGIDDSALVSVLTTGDWYVNYLFETTDDTADYIDYVFNFGTDNTATATDMSGPVNGTWSTASGGQTALALNIDFGTGAPLDRLAEGWDVLESTTDIIRLQYSGGAGQDVFLNFGRTPFDPGIDDSALVSVLTTGDWYVNYLFETADDTADYVDYVFNFGTDNTATATDMSGPVNGTWSTASGGQTALALNLDFGTGAPLDRLAEGWDVLESTTDIIRLQYSGGAGPDVFLNFGRIPYDGGVDDPTLENILTTGDWYVNYLFDNQDKTSDVADYVFNFSMDNTATTTNTAGSTNGSWSLTVGDEVSTALSLNFGSSNPLGDISDTWDVLEVTNDVIRLKGISNGNGSENWLTFKRTPFDGSSGNDELIAILSDGLWIVASYIEDGSDETANYVGYEIDFNMNGNVSASNGSNTNDGTWEVFSSGNQMDLNFGNDQPFRDFNDNDWDVISVSNTEVIIQDVSGGGNNVSANILTFQKL